MLVRRSFNLVISGFSYVITVPVVHLSRSVSSVLRPLFSTVSHMKPLPTYDRNACTKFLVLCLWESAGSLQVLSGPPSPRSPLSGSCSPRCPQVKNYKVVASALSASK